MAEITRKSPSGSPRENLLATENNPIDEYINERLVGF
jgi:hypothetical protein